MTIYKIYDANDSRVCPAVFVVPDCGKIHAEGGPLPFSEHPTIKTEKDLFAHLDKMTNEGFTIIKTCI